MVAITDFHVPHNPTLPQSVLKTVNKQFPYLSEILRGLDRHNPDLMSQALASALGIIYEGYRFTSPTTFLNADRWRAKIEETDTELTDDPNFYRQVMTEYPHLKSALKREKILQDVDTRDGFTLGWLAASDLLVEDTSGKEPGDVYDGDGYAEAQDDDRPMSTAAMLDSINEPEFPEPGPQLRKGFAEKDMFDDEGGESDEPSRSERSAPDDGMNLKMVTELLSTINLVPGVDSVSIVLATIDNQAGLAIKAEGGSGVNLDSALMVQTLVRSSNAAAKVQITSENGVLFLLVPLT